MKTLLILAAVLTAGTAVAAEVTTSRAATLKRCNVQAKQQYPGKYYDWDNTQTATYKSCMWQAGENP